jgi:hypothetical protein
MKKTSTWMILAGMVAAVGVFGFSAKQAQAGGCYVYRPAPVYCAPPVYYAPPVYCPPRVVYRSPVVYRAPVYRSTRVVRHGYAPRYHGGRSVSFGFSYRR